MSDINLTSIWTVRKMSKETSEEIKLIGRHRGWTLAETLTHMVEFVQEAQKYDDDHPLEKDATLEYILKNHGLQFVKR